MNTTGKNLFLGLKENQSFDREDHIINFGLLSYRKMSPVRFRQLFKSFSIVFHGGLNPEYIVPLEPELVMSTPTYDPLGTETTYKVSCFCAK